MAFVAAMALTGPLTEGCQFVSCPVAVSKAAIRVRVAPATVVKSPPM